MNRQKAIDYIEGMTGCYSAVWHEWPDEDIRKLYIFVCVADHGEVNLRDSIRVDVTL